VTIKAPLMKLLAGVAVASLIASTGSAQSTFDGKGRRYQCLPGDWSCTVLPPPGAPLPPLPRPRPPTLLPSGPGWEIETADAADQAALD
jgi:hypothetical protein